MRDMEQSDDMINMLFSEIHENKVLWDLIIERVREGNLIQKMSQENGKRYDLEPEFFPRIRRPAFPELISEFLADRFGERLPRIANQLALKVVTEARRRI